MLRQRSVRWRQSKALGLCSTRNPPERQEHRYINDEEVVIRHAQRRTRHAKNQKARLNGERKIVRPSSFGNVFRDRPYSPTLKKGGSQNDEVNRQPDKSVVS